MTVFRDTPDDRRRLDWGILSKGGVSLYFRLAVLRGDAAWLAAERYVVSEFDTKCWRSIGDMHDDLSRGLSFPDYYGRNMDALHDCMRHDVVVPGTGGRALILLGYDAFVCGAGAGPSDAPGRGAATALLDCIISASHDFLLTGRRFLALVQSNDPMLGLGTLAAKGAHWNEKEWLNSSRL